MHHDRKWYPSVQRKTQKRVAKNKIDQGRILLKERSEKKSHKRKFEGFDEEE
jgi:(2Fe-2S) ferredoxin